MTLGFSTILMPAVLDPKEGEVLHLNKSEISWISKYTRKYVAFEVKLCTYNEYITHFSRPIKQEH